MIANTEQKNISKTNLWILVAIVSLVGVTLGSYWGRSKPSRSEISLAGFSAPKLDGSKLDINAATEPVLIVNFWASWCPPCADELPSLLKLTRTLGGQVRVIALSQDEDEKKMRDFLSKFGELPKGFEVAWDRDGSLAKKLGVAKLPESFILDRDRKLVKKIEGYDDWASPGVLSYFRLLSEGEL